MPDRVIFLYEYMHKFRIIYTDGRGHHKDWQPSLVGDSFGQVEGDTLVIDIVGVTANQTWLDGHGNRHSSRCMSPSRAAPSARMSSGTSTRSSIQNSILSH